MLTKSDKIVDLIWSPNNENEFVAFGNDLYLYRTEDGKPSQSENTIQLSEETHAELIASYGDNTNPRIVAWCMDSANPYTFAVYFTNQNIKLISLNPESLKNSRHLPFRGFDIHKDFAFKQVRLCNNLAWNYHQKTYIAASFQPIRNEHSILVWDAQSLASKVDTESVILTTTSPFPAQGLYSSNSNLLSSLAANGEQRPVYETGNSDTCNSLAWSPYSQFYLLTGVNGKSLKVYDIRASKASHTVNTKYVYNFTMDSSNTGSENQAASYYDKCVAIWDLRRFDKPVSIITESEQIIKVQWGPSRQYKRSFEKPPPNTKTGRAPSANDDKRNSMTGKLITLTKSSDQLNIYSVETVNDSLSSSVRADENAPTQIIIDKKTRKCPAQKISTNRESSTPNDLMTASITGALPEITNFCWNNFDANKLLVSVNASLSSLRTLCLSDTIAVAWSPNGDICWSSSVGRISLIENIDMNEFDFLAQLKERARIDYGVKYDIVTISNGTATSVPSTVSSLNQQPGTPTSSPVIPLLLSLSASTLSGMSCLIRPEFSSFSKMYSSYDRVITKNVKFLWQWFEAVNLLYEKMIPMASRGHLVEPISMLMRNHLIEYFPQRYSGLKALLDQLIDRRATTTSPDSNTILEDRFRLIAFNLCGWEIKDDNLSRQFFTNLENTKQIERAACLAVLTHNFDLAFDILDAASKTDDRYGCFWIALKCFQEEYQQQQSQQPQYLLRAAPPQQQSSTFSSPTIKLQSSPTVSSSQLNSSSSFSKSPFFNSMSSQTHNDSSIHLLNNTIASESAGRDKSKSAENFNDPYLQAMFNYLTIKEDAIGKILYDQDILFQDRVALSVHFMFNPSKQIELQQYFQTIITEECIKKADLHGVLLTGLSPACIGLFQNFIEQTNDVQTASLAIIHTPFADVIQSKQVQNWIDSYRELLNSFKFWEKRAELDVLKMKIAKIQPYIAPITTSLSSTDNSHGNYDPSNVSSSSSSSFSSNNLGNLTPKHHSTLNTITSFTSHHQSFHHPQNYHPNYSNFSHVSHQSGGGGAGTQYHLNSRHSLPVNQYVPKSMQAIVHGHQSHTYPNFINQTPLYSSLAVHMVCNKCGKNLLDKTPYVDPSQRISTLNYNQTTGTLHPYMPPGGQQISIGAKPSSHGVSISAPKHNDYYIFGCQSCAHFLPQCTICLKVMRISLYPSPAAAMLSNSSSHMNRSQSFFMQSPQLMLPVVYSGKSTATNGGGSSKQLSAAANLKSPLSSTNLAKIAGQAVSNNIPQSKSSNEILVSQTGRPSVPVKFLAKQAFNCDIIDFLANSKLGKWFAWCQSCKHGGHIEHLIEWFGSHQTCPFMHCKCQCLSIDFMN